MFSLDQRLFKTRKFLTGRFRKPLRFMGPPGTADETKRSVERPPSRFMALPMAHPSGEPEARAEPRAAREHEDVFPIHQRVPPSVTSMERRADLPLSSPPTLLPLSISKGPAWMSSKAPYVAEGDERREMESWPEKLSAKMPEPSEEEDFHAP